MAANSEAESVVITEEQKQQYSKYVKEITPTHNFRLQLVRAFLVGGAICILGQFILNTLGNMGMEQQEAASWCSVILVFFSALLTGLGLYARLAKWGGAGALVPITGFANGVASCAIEYHVEGQVFGIGCKIFTIAGPVILYGVFASWLLGIGYWLMLIWR
ncbi:MAG: SpoVA/SpoVAEb family sporulation membrane protein [Lachnospiraceae bacterium]|nr:SpoVA/SpoVAEb family sporulation membrane protein [Lachnospiraceae bacterium]